MKKILILCVALFATTAIAHTIDWYVDGQVYQTTSCESGDSVTPPTPPAKYGYTFQEWYPLYKQLEYIETNGNSYINTGIPVNILTNPTIETKFKKLVGGDIDWFGTSSTAKRTILYNVSYNNPTSVVQYIRWGTQSSIPIQGNVIPLYFYGAFHTLRLTGLPQLKIYVDDVLISTVYDEQAKMESPEPILIGRGRTGGGRAQWTSFKIMNNEDVLFDGIPVLRTTDGAVGLFDQASQRFFGSAGGVPLIAGPVVGSE